MPIQLKYVGNKTEPFFRAGVTWNGYGAVNDVSTANAASLLRSPTQWVTEGRPGRPTLIVDGVEIDRTRLKIPPERMNKLELRALAKIRWGKSLNPQLSTRDMVDQVEEWQNDLDPKVGVE